MTDNEIEDSIETEMIRVKSDAFYVFIFSVILVLIYLVPIFGLLSPLFAAMIVTQHFRKHESRNPNPLEIKRLGLKSFLIVLGLNFFFLTGLLGSGLGSAGFEGVGGKAVYFAIVFVAFIIVSELHHFMIRRGYSHPGSQHEKLKNAPLFDQSGQKALWDVDPGLEAERATLGNQAHNNTQDSWVAPHERGGFAVREERAPWLKWTVSLLALLIVGGGAAWLTSKVVISDDLPVIEKAEKVVDEKTNTPPPKSADDEAWVKALEIDTVKGYRDYLAAFPNGRHKEDAIRLINEFDNEAWATAQERDTIQGYEDYIEAWPEGLHVAEARKRIAEIKAAEEARRKNAQEAARQEAAAWQAAAQANTVPAYEGYLSKFPAGKNAAEAQSRIDRLRASAADEAAWAAADATKTADAYQQYLTSFPQGKYVPEAIKRLEDLRPSPGKTFQDCAGCPIMVTLATGTVNLGAGPDDGEAKPNEKPARPVTFSKPFSMGVTEVTFSQYEACVSAGACGAVPGDNGWGRGNRPVINVSWSDAMAYAEWLSQKTGKPYSLPSDAQWEFAARGGEKSIYPGGSPKAVCAFANGASKESGLPWANQACTDLAADRTLPVGSLSKNKFGIQDMIGNVSEWVLDCNTLNLRDAPVDGSADARGSCSQRIVRGGSWFTGAEGLRYSARVVQRRGDTNDFTGFRVVRN